MASRAINAAVVTTAVGLTAAATARVAGRRLVARTERRLCPNPTVGRYPANERARALHETLGVVDLHADSLLWGRDLLLRGDRGHVDVPRLIEGNVALQVFAAEHQVAAPPEHRAQRRHERRHHPARDRLGLAAARPGGACSPGRSTWPPGPTRWHAAPTAA